MIHAFVQIKTENKKNFSEIAKSLLDIKGITEVHTVTGDYDLCLVMRASSHEQVAKIVTNQIHEIDGIYDTNTIIALNSYSNYDFEKAWNNEMS